MSRRDKTVRRAPLWALAVLLLTASVAAAAAAGVPLSAGARPQGAPAVAADGLRLLLPHGWSGRVVKGRKQLPALQAGNFKLPRVDDGVGHTALSRLSPGEIFIDLLVVGYPPPRTLAKGNVWSRTPLPIVIRRSDFGGFEGVGPSAVSRRSLARRWVIVKQHALIVLVSFGVRNPSPAALRKANRVLAGLSVHPTTRYGLPARLAEASLLGVGALSVLGAPHDMRGLRRVG
jgi:hypothetical protein